MTQRLYDLILDRPRERPDPAARQVLGVLPGEGIGPEVIGASLRVLTALETATGCSFEVRTGGFIGRQAEALGGEALSDEVVDFCQGVFEDGGAVLAGAGGGRFVYDLRRRFDLFCKLSPLRSYAELQGVSRLQSAFASDIDILVIRENIGGIYQGEQWEEHSEPAGRTVFQRFSYSESQVKRILGVAGRIARARRGVLAVVIKEGGMEQMSALWRDCAADATRDLGLDCTFLDVDYAAYCMVQHAQELDVVVAPNLFGDMLSDVGSIVAGSRAVSYGASFSSDGCAVYQTNHGSAYDLAGSDQANPVGQLLSMAMMLRESYGLEKQAELVERAIRVVWQEGWRTRDLAADGTRTLGTRAMGERIAAAVASLADGPG